MTYPHPAVQKELEQWVKRKVDVTQWTETARVFAVTAVPVAVLVSSDGTLLDRIPNFVEPEAFATGLRAARRK